MKIKWSLVLAAMLSLSSGAEESFLATDLSIEDLEGFEWERQEILALDGGEALVSTGSVLLGIKGAHEWLKGDRIRAEANALITYWNQTNSIKEIVELREALETKLSPKVTESESHLDEVRRKVSAVSQDSALDETSRQRLWKDLELGEQRLAQAVAAKDEALKSLDDQLSRIRGASNGFLASLKTAPLNELKREVLKSEIEFYRKADHVIVERLPENWHATTGRTVGAVSWVGKHSSVLKLKGAVLVIAGVTLQGLPILLGFYDDEEAY